MKSLSEKLVAEGHAVYGVRLSDHGTSPVDLRERSWEDWLRAIQRGYEILAAYLDKICLVGFSAGGALSLIFASEHHPKLAGAVIINPPVKFRNKNMIFVPLLHGISQLVRWAPSFEGVVSYRANDTEHARINYRHILVRALYELVRMNYVLSHQLKRVSCPCLLMQSTADPVVTADSSKILQNKLINTDVTYVEVESNRHGILYENVAGTHQRVMQYIQQLLNNWLEPTDKTKSFMEEQKWAS